LHIYAEETRLVVNFVISGNYTFPVMSNLTELILDNCGIITVADGTFTNLGNYRKFKMVAEIKQAFNFF